MTTNVAHHHNRPIRPVRGWAMACAALVICASGALAQTAFAAAPAAAGEAYAGPVLARAQLDALLATPDKVLILDVRRADEISAIGGFPAYLNIQAAELERYLSFVPRDRRIVPVSNHAGRAKRAAALLASRGFEVAGVAGAQDYAAEGGTLTGFKPPAAVAAAPAR